MVAVAAAAQTAPPHDLMARIHFAGANQISADTNSAAFTNLFCSAEAQALKSQTLDKLSRAPAAWFKSEIPPGAGDGVVQLRPLLDDLLKSEWVFEMRDATNGSPEYALAIRLSEERAQLWNKNLAAILKSWTGLDVIGDNLGEWLLQKNEPPNLFRFSRSGDWVVIDCGQDKLSLREQILPVPTKLPIADTNWLTADLNWPRLAQLFPKLQLFDFPKIQMQVVGRDRNLRANGRLILSQPLPPRENWRIPTNTIHQPLMSFTAGRGIGSWLERQSWAQPYEIQPPPDQFFIWTLPQIPFQTFAAAPVPEATAALLRLHAKLSALPATNSQNAFATPMTMELTNGQISWDGLPFVAPFVQALHEPAGDFLFGGFFPNTPRSRAWPPALLQQLNTPDLVYYHWEITAGCLSELPELTQFMLMMTQHKQLDADSAAGKWLNHIGPTPGNSVTEVRQTAPNELTFTREAPDGLTAIELVALANWLEAANFPGCDLRLPPRRKHQPPQLPGAPARPAPASPVLPH